MILSDLMSPEDFLNSEYLLNSFIFNEFACWKQPQILKKQMLLEYSLYFLFFVNPLRFAEQINWLGSICWEHWSLKVKHDGNVNVTKPMVIITFVMLKNTQNVFLHPIWGLSLAKNFWFVKIDSCRCCLWR